MVQLIKPRCSSEVFRASTVAAAVITTACSAVIWPVFSRTGWPLNHEGNSFFTRTGIYSQHISSWDFLPMWSSKDNFGFGSPQPMLYHKLFYLVSGSVQSVFQQLNIETVVLITVWLFLMIGAFGMYAFCIRVGVRTVPATAAAVMLVTANYTITNWFIRGAMAEFSAAMLFPWVLFTLTGSLQSRKFSTWLAVVFALLFLAHSVLAFYVALFVLIAMVAVCARDRQYFEMFCWGSLVKPSLIGVGMVVPYASAMMQLGKNYDLSRMTTNEYLPQNNFVGLSKYVDDPDWHWGETYLRMTVELGKPLIAMVIIAFIVIVATKIRKTESRLDESKLTAVVVLMVMGIAAVFLQTKLSTPIYKYLPGASYLQFPWRLEALLVPILIAGCIAVFTQYLPRGINFLVVSIALCMLVVAGSFSDIRYERITYQPADSNNLQFSAFNEYVPVSARNFSQQSLKEIELLNTQTGCSVQTSQREEESLKRLYTVQCAHDALVVMPEFSSVAHRVQVDSKAKVRCMENTKNPSLCVVRVAAGQHNIYIHYPTLWSVLRSLIN